MAAANDSKIRCVRYELMFYTPLLALDNGYGFLESSLQWLVGFTTEI